MSEFVPTGADDHSRLVALMTGILVLTAGMGGAFIFIAMICIKKKMKKYARRRLLRRDSASRLSFSTPSPSIEELGDEMWTPLPEDALKRRRVDVILQPVHAEHDETTSNGTNGFVPIPEDEDGDAGEELHAEDDANATLDEEEHEGGGDEDEDRSAYRLCYNDLDMYRSDEDQTADEGSGYLDEEEGYMHELEQWSEEFLLSEMGGSSSTSDLHRLTQPLPPGAPTNDALEGGSPRVETQFRFGDPAGGPSQEDEGMVLTDWNERFQTTVEKLRGFDLHTPLDERYNTNRALIHLAQDFIYSSCSYGRIIISEAFVPDHMKTIKPTAMGGIVGGDKYIVNNILFKFAVDSHGLYGSDYAASKVAGHELKGLLAYFNLGIRDLCLPLMALIDYRGFRLLAMSILPIKKSTIVYGSNDYGHTMHAENKKLGAKMRIAARKLNIKPHRCGVSKAHSQVLPSPADLEGHVGGDNRTYLLDFSRVMPPEFPKPGIKMAHLFRLLRPEYVRTFPKPLCSDAFSGFIRMHNPEQHNAELEEATRNLITNVVPDFAPELAKLIAEAKRKGDLENFRLTEAVHSRGINIRHLGILRSHMVDQDGRTLLFVEMCARVVKNNLRLRLRERMRKLKLPLEEPYHRLVIDYMNLVIGHNDQSEEYWAKNLKTSLVRKFEGALNAEEAEDDYALKCVLDYFSDNSMDGKLLLFNRIQKICGLKFTHRVNEEFSKHKNCWVARGEQPLDDTDLEEIGLRVKHMNIISYAQGHCLHLKGNMAWNNNPINAQRFFNMAMEKYEEALSSAPWSSDILVNCAEIATKFLEGEEKNLANLNFSINHPKAQEANNYFLRAIQSNTHDSYAIFQYAQFLDRCGLIKKAEEFYLRSLEINPNNAACLQEYGNFLALRKKDESGAEKFFLRSSQCTQQRIAPSLSRYGSRRDFQDLSQLSVSDFRQRARNEINLSSSPTLKLTSDEIKKDQRSPTPDGTRRHQRTRSLVSRTLIGASEGPDEMENMVDGNHSPQQSASSVSTRITLHQQVVSAAAAAVVATTTPTAKVRTAEAKEELLHA